MSLELIVEKIAEKTQKKSLFAIFDRDGTLVPIVPNPDDAILSDSIKNLLIQLNSVPQVEVAILSARGITRLKDDFSSNEVILAGNYGLEVLLRNKIYSCEPTANHSRDLLNQVKSEILKSLTKETKVILADDYLTLCLHWHLTPNEQRELVHSTVKQLENRFPGLVFASLPTSYEVWPPIKWNKSHGIEHMISTLKIDSDDYSMLYVGDSASDEPAFSWVNEHDGTSVHVGKNESAAQFQVESTKEVEQLLKKLIDIF